MHKYRSFYALIALFAALLFAQGATAKNAPWHKPHHRSPVPTKAQIIRSRTLPSLKGSVEARQQENAWVKLFGLHRVEDRAELLRLIKAKELVPIRSGNAWRISNDLAKYEPQHRATYAHALPCVKAFMREAMLEGHHRFGDVYLISSLVRPEAYHQKVIARNANAARPNSLGGPSSHLTGATIDFRTSNLSLKGLQWMRRTLAQMEADGRIQATEEVHNRTFHVFVRPDFDNRD